MTSERVDYKAKTAPTTNKIGQGQADDSQKNSVRIPIFLDLFQKNSICINFTVNVL